MSDIILRAPEPEDLEIMLAVENDPLLWEHSSENTGPYTRYQMKQYIAENGKETLAQVFTDVRYPKANNEAFSRVLVDFMQAQGYKIPY